MTVPKNPEDGKSHPFLVNNLSFYYRIVSYRITIKGSNSTNVFFYNTPHEIILNLFAYHDEDRITYINRSNNQEVFTITFDRFKFMLAESIYEVTQPELELLYMRLILTNRFSKKIIDRGRFKQYDSYLSKFLLTIKGGYDGYLAYEQRRVVYYFKYCRLSAIHLLTTILDWNLKSNIHFNHINIPMDIQNQNVIAQCLRVSLNKQQFKIYNYSPVEDDNLQPKSTAHVLLRSFQFHNNVKTAELKDLLILIRDKMK